MKHLLAGSVGQQVVEGWVDLEAVAAPVGLLLEVEVQCSCYDLGVDVSSFWWVQPARLCP